MDRMLENLNIPRKLSFFSLFLILLMVFSTTGCSQFAQMLFKPYQNLASWIEYKSSGTSMAYDEWLLAPQPSSPSSDPLGYQAEDSTSSAVNDGSGSANSGQLKPVGFVNYGEFDAVVMPYSYIPLGSANQVQPDYTTTVSTANDGVGDWPNTSRFLLLPEGTYTWCIDWEEGDLDEDGQIDYFHYIQADSTILDEHDSDQTEFAQEVAISAPPSSGAIYEGRCEPAPLEIVCTEYDSQVTVHTYLVYETANPPDIRALTNVAENPSPPGIEVISGGNSTPWGGGMILWSAGDYVQATTSNPYTAFGGQIFGDQTIGWARVLFDGQEIWRGDASSYVIKEGAHYGVYVEVTCFPPGTHTMRIECLGIRGSGGGSSVPSGFFGFRE